VWVSVSVGVKLLEPELDPGLALWTVTPLGPSTVARSVELVATLSV
jgi:hypothetical protein